MFACCVGDINQEPGEIVETKTLPVLQEKGTQSTEKEDASGSFTVLVPAKRHATLGLELDTSGAHGPTVAEVKKGAVDDFNQLNPLRTILPHDMVVQMGDAKGTKAILAKMAAPLHDVKLTLHRPRRMQVKLRKEAKSSLGIKLIIKEMCCDYGSQTHWVSGQMECQEPLRCHRGLRSAPGREWPDRTQRDVG